MVKKKRPVNGKGKDLSTIGGRLAAERDLRGVKQMDLCVRLRVSKATQIKYESGQTVPDAHYLAELHDVFGFDVLYILTGERSAGALKPAHQNLIEAYEDAPEAVKIAAFGMLLTAYYPFRSHIEAAMKVPGFNRHELGDEEDSRYEAYQLERLKEDSDENGSK